MRTGDLLLERFEIERLAGTGGMGSVWRARDLVGGGYVAIKALHLPEPEDAARLLREARLLAELRHPGIVGYVADGDAPSGEMFLAMEWLDGEDLARTLRSGPLTVASA